MIDPRLLNHPKVREKAERLAKEAWEATKPSAPPSCESRAGTADSDSKWWVQGFTRLLSDPTRPETRDWLVRSGMEVDNRWEPREIKNGPHKGYWTTLDKSGTCIFEYSWKEDAEKYGISNRLEHWLALRDNQEFLVSEWLAVNP